VARVALGLSVHTGWAASVVAAGELREPTVVARDLIEMLADPARFVFHRAAELSASDARASVDRARTEAHANAREAIARIVRRVSDAGHTVRACAIVAKGGAMPELEWIVAAHPRIHSCEGMFYRDALVAAAERAGLRVVLVAPRELEPKTTRDAKLLADAAKTVGKPWAKDQKQAAMAAWRALTP
jgi:hypothetical protein